MTTKHTIHLDMDGVVADWDRAATEYLKSEFPIDAANKPEGRWPTHLWNELRNAPHFYRNLPKMEKADEMVSIARRFRDDLGWNLVMLTAIPRGNDCFEVFHDKIKWMADHYPEIEVHFGPYSHDKQDHCLVDGDILVDDRYDNCEQWEARGGIAVRVKKDGYDDALTELQDIYHALRSV
jgi:5'(3')-deoxyribonucleotidase